MPIDTNHLQIFQRYVLAYNSFDIEGMLQLLADDVRFENYSNDTLTASASNKHKFKELANKGKRIFDERKQEVLSTRWLENGLEARIRFRGKLSTDAANGAGTSPYVEIDGTSEVEIQQEKIVKLIDRS